MEKRIRRYNFLNFLNKKKIKINNSILDNFFDKRVKIKSKNKQIISGIFLNFAKKILFFENNFFFADKTLDYTIHTLKIYSFIL